MNSTDEAILTFAEAFARLGDRQHSELYLEALESIVRMAKAEERLAAQRGQPDDDELMRHLLSGTAIVLH